jgi:hypothetical protein
MPPSLRVALRRVDDAGGEHGPAVDDERVGASGRPRRVVGVRHTVIVQIGDGNGTFRLTEGKSPVAPGPVIRKDRVRASGQQGSDGEESKNSLLGQVGPIVG